jgi:integral membrane protein
LNSTRRMVHPVLLARITGIADGVSLLLLLGIAMPLKYWADLPLAVTIAGSVHGGIFIAYLLAVLYAQIRVQWHVGWSLLSILVAFVPFGNFVLDRYLKNKQSSFNVKPIPKVWLVYAIILFTFLDLFTQLPVMSTFATSLGASAMIAGFIVGMYSMSNTIGNILSGVFTDKYGSYKVLCAGLIFTSGSLLLYNVVDDVAGLLLVRFFHGLLGGFIVPAAFTYLANRTKTEKQGSQSAITGAFVGAAAIIGPAYSGIMASRTSVPFVFTTIAILGLVLFATTVVFLRSRHEQAVKERKKARKFAMNAKLFQAFMGAFFLMFSQGALAYLLPLHVESLGYSSRMSGTLMSMFGLVAVLMFILPTNRLFDRLPAIYSLSMGLGLIGLSQILIGQTSHTLLLYAILAMYGFGFSFLFPAINTLLAHGTTSENRGKAYGIFYALFSLGTVVGSSGIGLLPVSFGSLFIVTGCCLLTCAAGALITARRQ